MTLKLTLLAALVLGISSAARALEGYDGDNNPIPGASRHYAPEAFSREIYAKQRPTARRDGPGAAGRSATETPNVVRWRGRADAEDEGGEQCELQGHCGSHRCISFSSAAASSPLPGRRSQF
jgi:hypothetical protein